MSNAYPRPLRRWLRALVGVVTAVGLTAVPVISGADVAGAEPSAGVRCSEVDLPVALLGETAPSQFLHTELCVPSGGSDVVMVLIPGGSYDSEYFDFSYEPEKYSMVRAMNAAGIATANIDRLGTGQSSHPPSVLVTVDQNAHAVHHVVNALRNGSLGEAFSTVVLVGHSLGSGVAELVTARYPGVDGLIVTGLAAQFNLLGAVPMLLNVSEPAALQPQFADAGYDLGYITSAEGSRGIFYHLPQADPAVIAHDDATRATVALIEVLSLAVPVVEGMISPVTLPVCAQVPDICQRPVTSLLGPFPDIRVPTLVVIGEHDSLVCGGIGLDCSSASRAKAAEALHWRPEACLGLRLLPDVGHSINLHPAGVDWYDTAQEWTKNLLEWRNGPRTGCPTFPAGVS